jgi:hypothetical protein
MPLGGVAISHASPEPACAPASLISIAADMFAHACQQATKL